MKIITGGQVGVDRAAQDVAIYYGIPNGGFCPKGRKSLDPSGKIPAIYNMTESDKSDYPTRTRLNVEQSTSAIIFTGFKPKSKGTELSIKLCLDKMSHQDILIINPLYGYLELHVLMLKDFFSTQRENVFIAGSREGYDLAYAYLFESFKKN